MVVGGKIFKRGEDIVRVVEVKVHLVGLRRVVGCKRKNQRQVDITIYLKANSLESQKSR
jgi:hypothetical protein